MNVVFIIPTGIGCSIGGHAGDATPAAKLIASVCDKIILHPNVVNASDINEMPENALYVEGSILDRFLFGMTRLQQVQSNKILVVVNKATPALVNAVNAARSTIGIQATMMALDTPLAMSGWVEDDRATGEVTGLWAAIDQLQDTEGYDAVALVTPIRVHPDTVLEYFRSTGCSVNPWGGIEAFVSSSIADAISKPVAHAPEEDSSAEAAPALAKLLYNEVVDRRKAAEVSAEFYIHCILKGLHRAPRPSSWGISRESVMCLVTPSMCFGRPHEACLSAGIPVIAVRENITALRVEEHPDFLYVENYLEAAGLIACMNAGVNPQMVRSPAPVTKRG